MDERRGHVRLLVNRARAGAVALETTLVVHGVPRASGRSLALELDQIVREGGASAALVGVVAGRPTVGMTLDELDAMLAAAEAGGVPKVNAANLGLAIHRGQHAATTVSATMELASRAGVRVFATGGIGGVHKGLAQRLDISADLAALARVPMVVVCSGVKTLLDVGATREALEALGVCVVGYRTDRFPAFYLRDAGEGGARVDARFDDEADLAEFLACELARRASAVLVCNPIPAEDELDRDEFDAWLAQAEGQVGPIAGRNVTPAILGRLHELSDGATLRANLALVRSNAALAARLAALLASRPAPGRSSGRSGAV